MPRLALTFWIASKSTVPEKSSIDVVCSGTATASPATRAFETRKFAMLILQRGARFQRAANSRSVTLLTCSAKKERRVVPEASEGGQQDFARRSTGEALPQTGVGCSVFRNWREGSVIR